LGLLLILVSNVYTMYVAKTEQWSLDQLMLPYWVQSIVIGWYARRRILALRGFSVEGVSVDDEPLPETRATRSTIANFVMALFGGYCFLLGLWVFRFFPADRYGAPSTYATAELLETAVASLLFVLAQQVEHRRNLALDSGRRPNIGSMAGLPFLRIFPVHAVMILTGGGYAAASGVMLFGIAKAILDVVVFLCAYLLVGQAAPATPDGDREDRTTGPE
jgi:hypothetical protein